MGCSFCLAPGTGPGPARGARGGSWRACRGGGWCGAPAQPSAHLRSWEIVAGRGRVPARRRRPPRRGRGGRRAQVRRGTTTARRRRGVPRRSPRPGRTPHGPGTDLAREIPGGAGPRLEPLLRPGTLGRAAARTSSSGDRPPAPRSHQAGPGTRARHPFCHTPVVPSSRAHDHRHPAHPGAFPRRQRVRALGRPAGGDQGARRAGQRGGDRTSSCSAPPAPASRRRRPG